MSRLRFLFVAAVFSLIFTACGDAEREPEPVETTTMAPAIPKAQVTNPDTKPYRTLYVLQLGLIDPNYDLTGAIGDWNKNGKTRLILVKNVPENDVPYIIVEQKKTPLSGYAGLHWLDYDSFQGRYYSKIELNPYYAKDINKSTTCHELGHALGLRHNKTERSCLSETRISQSPSAGELKIVRNRPWTGKAVEAMLDSLVHKLASKNKIEAKEVAPLDSQVQKHPSGISICLGAKSKYSSREVITDYSLSRGAIRL